MLSSIDMIEIGHNPEGDKKNGNKFISPGGEGQRGTIIALSEKKTEAIVLALNSSFKGDVKWGRLYLIREEDPDKWPIVDEEVTAIPETGFKVVI